MNIEKRDKYFKEGVDHFNSKRYDEAIQDFDKAISEDNNYKEAYFFRGRCYYFQKKYKEAVEEFNIAIEIDKEFKESYFLRGICYYNQRKYEEAVKEFNKAIEIDKEFKEAYLYMGWSYYIEKCIPENTMSALDCCSKVLEIDPYYKEVYKLRAYIHKGKGETNNAILDEVRYKDVDFGNYIEDKNCTKVCNLFLKVLNLKEKLIYNEEYSVAHYTKINNIKYLVKPVEKKDGENSDYPKLRLNNVAYMNDPTEGDVFKKLLEQKSDNIELINNLYNTSGKDKREVIQGKSNTFLASFSKSIDTSLPMWIQYTDNGQGCCLVFKSDFFDKEDNDSLASMFNTKDIDANNLSENYCLYKVAYISDYKKSEYDREIKEIVSELENLKSDLQDNEIKEIVINILDQVRFLFKSKDYEHEQEVRLIKFTNDVKYTGDAEGYRVPHVYIDMERELEIEEVVLGPKVSEPIEIANYLYYTGKVDKVTKSHIKYK